MTTTTTQDARAINQQKLYSVKAIGGATFLGGPLGAGYMISENFKALHAPEKARTALILAIIFTLVLFGGLFIIPEYIIDRVPKQLIPIAYTAIIYGIVEWKQGDALKLHQENDAPFYSGWRAAGIGLISLAVLFLGIFAYVLIESNNPAYDIYDTKIEVFSNNESQSLAFYEGIESKNDATIIQELNTLVIPKWEENVAIVENLISLEGLPSEIQDQNKALLEYSELRLQNFILIKKTILEDTDKYEAELNTLNNKIETVLDVLN